MNVLLDTNILGRMAEPGPVQHQLAVDAVAALVCRGDSPCLVPQVLYEFWVVATRPAAANGLGMTPSSKCPQRQGKRVSSRPPTRERRSCSRGGRCRPAR